MKRTGYIALGVALFLLAFGVGLAVHFPTVAVTRAIEGSLNAAPSLSVTLSPVRLSLTGLRSDRLIVRDSKANGPTLAVLSDVRVPFGPSLARGTPLSAKVGTEGRVRGFMAWNGSEVVVDELSVRLEDLSLPLWQPGVTVKGRVNLSGKFRPPPARSGQRVEIPEGEIRGKAESVEIGGIEVAGAKLPITRLQSVDLSVKTGRTVQIERLEMQGDLQGTVQGTINANPERPAESRMNLTVAATLRSGWIQETGPLRVILEGFFPGGRIEGTLSGTTAAPNWFPGRGRP